MMLIHKRFDRCNVAEIVTAPRFSGVGILTAQIQRTS